MIWSVPVLAGLNTPEAFGYNRQFAPNAAQMPLHCRYLPKESLMSKIAEVLQKHQSTVIEEWVKNLLDGGRRADLISDKELKAQATELLNSITASARNGKVTEVNGPEWSSTREMLHDIASSRAKQGFTSSETATFVLSMKQPIFTRHPQ